MVYRNIAASLEVISVNHIITASPRISMFALLFFCIGCYIISVECSEKTRRDYRNPAAHREAMSYISARECIDYLLEQTKMLKIVLQDMRVR